MYLHSIQAGSQAIDRLEIKEVKMVSSTTKYSDKSMGLKKGPWTPDEDAILLAYIQDHGHGSWRSLPSKAGLQRCGKSCRLRWINYLRPDIKRGDFSFQEEQTIIQLHALLGNRWSSIATHLPKRTDNEIKNHWNTHLKKKLVTMGIDPVTHKPKDNLALTIYESKHVANISHMAQWESARLQAEARLVQESKLLSGATHHHSPIIPPPPPPQRLPCLDILKVWEWTNPGKDISSMVLNGFLPGTVGPENVPFQATPAAVGLYCNEAKGIMENSMELHNNYGDDSLGFPSFIDDGSSFENSNDHVPGSCRGAHEENTTNSWNILNIPTSQTDSLMF